MNKAEQVEFTDQLINKIRDEIKADVIAHAPENWDGIELRQFIADLFAESVLKGTMNRSRRIAYNKFMQNFETGIYTLA